MAVRPAHMTDRTTGRLETEYVPSLPMPGCSHASRQQDQAGCGPARALEGGLRASPVMAGRTAPSVRLVRLVGGGVMEYKVERKSKCGRRRRLATPHDADRAWRWCSRSE